MSNVNTLQIANQLKLSRNTVSKALNNSPEVNEKTKQLVISTAVKMGYKKVNKQDYETYATKQTNYDICLLVHEREMGVSFWNLILKGVEDYLTTKRCRIIISILSKREEENDVLPLTLQGNQTSGILAVGTYSENYFKKIKETGIPMVTIDTTASTMEHKLLNDTILTCNESSVYEITEHLINNGCSEIVFAGNPNYCKSINERWKGYVSAMRDYNLPIPKGYEIFQGINLDEEYDVIHSRFETVTQFPKALVCANDTLAGSLIIIMKERGIRIPEDVLISGFDNYDSIFPNNNSLTTVDYNISEIGTLAARQILYRIANPTSSVMLIRAAARVIFRESTGQ